MRQGGLHRLLRPHQARGMGRGARADHPVGAGSLPAAVLTRSRPPGSSRLRAGDRTAVAPPGEDIARDTLYGVIGVIASSPDLDRVLAEVVDVLTKATECHACFVYLRRDGRLRLRAASRVYAHLVGHVEVAGDEGSA